MRLSLPLSWMVLQVNHHKIKNDLEWRRECNMPELSILLCILDGDMMTVVDAYFMCALPTP